MDAHEKDAHDAMQLCAEELIEEAIRKEAYEDGEKRGEQRGILSTLFGIVPDGLLGAGDASQRAGLSLAAFNAKMAEYDARPRA